MGGSGSGVKQLLGVMGAVAMVFVAVYFMPAEKPALPPAGDYMGASGLTGEAAMTDEGTLPVSDGSNPGLPIKAPVWFRTTLFLVEPQRQMTGEAAQQMKLVPVMCDQEGNLRVPLRHKPDGSLEIGFEEAARP